MKSAWRSRASSRSPASRPMVTPSRRAPGAAALALVGGLAFAGALVARFEALAHLRLAAGTPALATSVSEPAPPEAPRVFPDRRAPRNARLLVSVSRAWVAKQWSASPPGMTPVGIELHDAAGRVVSHHEEVPAGSD